jgi:hypothetical protein
MLFQFSITIGFFDLKVVATPIYVLCQSLYFMVVIAFLD